jgi:hypothetical protein
LALAGFGRVRRFAECMPHYLARSCSLPRRMRHGPNHDECYSRRISRMRAACRAPRQEAGTSSQRKHRALLGSGRRHRCAGCEEPRWYRTVLLVISGRALAAGVCPPPGACPDKRPRFVARLGGARRRRRRAGAPFLPGALPGAGSAGVMLASFGPASDLRRRLPQGSLRWRASRDKPAHSTFRSARASTPARRWCQWARTARRTNFKVELV